MAYYRAYLHDSSGHIFLAFEIDSPNDASAIEAARQYVDGRDVELWQEARFILRIRPKGKARLARERLAEEAKRFREEAQLLPPGAVRNEVIRRARQAETGLHMSEWLRPPRFAAAQVRRQS
jgi:hypothetical protein